MQDHDRPLPHGELLKDEPGVIDLGDGGWLARDGLERTAFPESPSMPVRGEVHYGALEIAEGIPDRDPAALC